MHRTGSCHISCSKLRGRAQGPREGHDVCRFRQTRARGPGEGHEVCRFRQTRGRAWGSLCDQATVSICICSLCLLDTACPTARGHRHSFNRTPVTSALCMKAACSERSYMDRFVLRVRAPMGEFLSWSFWVGWCGNARCSAGVVAVAEWLSADTHVNVYSFQHHLMVSVFL